MKNTIKGSNVTEEDVTNEELYSSILNRHLLSPYQIVTAMKVIPKGLFLEHNKSLI